MKPWDICSLPISPLKVGCIGRGSVIAGQRGHPRPPPSAPRWVPRRPLPLANAPRRFSAFRTGDPRRMLTFLRDIAEEGRLGQSGGDQRRDRACEDGPDQCGPTPHFQKRRPFSSRAARVRAIALFSTFQTEISASEAVKPFNPLSVSNAIRA